MKLIRDETYFRGIEVMSQHVCFMLSDFSIQKRLELIEVQQDLATQFQSKADQLLDLKRLQYISDGDADDTY